jgi:glycerol uptake facilitator-like aquaporin
MRCRWSRICRKAPSCASFTPDRRCPPTRLLIWRSRLSSVARIAAKARTGPTQWFAEFVATFGLLVTIATVVRFRAEAIPFVVGLYITAACWFTASPSFAKPAVTVARALTDTFAGIAPNHVLPQLAGGLAGMGLAGCCA